MIKVDIWFDNEYVTQEYNLPRMWVVDVIDTDRTFIHWTGIISVRTHTTLFPAKPTRKQVSRCIRAAKKVFKSS